MSTKQGSGPVAASEGGVWVLVHDEQGDFQLPLVLRPIAGTGLYDAVTPYGYGGLHMSNRLSPAEAEARWTSARELLAAHDVVSLFLRLPPFLPEHAERASALPGLTVIQRSRTVMVPTGTVDEMWSAMHGRSRTAVRSAEKAGGRPEVVPASAEYIRETRELYQQTMRRVGAAESYLFPDEYYSELASLGEQLRIARVVDDHGACVAASFVLVDARFAHYHLSGSAGRLSGANNLLLWELATWSAEAQLEGVHLGGGVTDGDSLFKFKSSLGGRVLNFSVGTCVVDRGHYDVLTAQRAVEMGVDAAALHEGKFFPAYRAGA